MMRDGDMIYLKSVLAGIAIVSTVMPLIVTFASHRHGLGWGGYVDTEPIYFSIQILFFAAGYSWEFRRAAKNSSPR
jgi:hypothetical protein